jgi:hypothetical protein
MSGQGFKGSWIFNFRKVLQQFSFFIAAKSNDILAFLMIVIEGIVAASFIIKEEVLKSFPLKMWSISTCRPWHSSWVY